RPSVKNGATLAVACRTILIQPGVLARRAKHNRHYSSNTLRSPRRMALALAERHQCGAGMVPARLAYFLRIRIESKLLFGADHSACTGTDVARTFTLAWVLLGLCLSPRLAAEPT